MSSVTLTSSVRHNLNSLQTTLKLLSEASEQVATGLKVSTALDNPTSYYAALNNTEEADSLTSRLDGMEESVEVINAADNGITTIDSYLEQMQGIVDDALATTDSEERQQLGEQYNELIAQIKSIANDSGYGGTNLLSDNNSLTVQFAAGSGDSTLTLDGINISGSATNVDDNGEIGSSSVVSTEIVTDENGLTTSVSTSYALTIDSNGEDVIGLQSAGTSGDAWEIDWGSDDYESLLTGLQAQIESMRSSLETQASALANNLSVITTREDFTNNKITILEEGATNLTAADTEEAAALVTSLTAAQSLGIQTLSLASDAASNALALIT